MNLWLGKLATWLGIKCRILVHFFKGHKPFHKYIKNKNGKFSARYCVHCGKRWDRLNGKWKYIGRYGRK